MIDGLEGLSYQRFMLHYNFPPYSVGEVGRFGAPGRREVGHGKLAWRALRPVLPSDEEFPYTIRVLVRHHREQRLLVDGDGVRRQPGDDGCRRAAEAAGLRHRHGPDPRRQRFRGHLRHPRRRGPSRRHGLQGRRHARRASPRCRWTSRSPASPRRSCAPRSSQANEGRAHILSEMAKALDHTRDRAFGACAADRDDAACQGEDPRSDRHRRQGDPRDRRRDRRQGRHRRRGH